MLTGSEGHMIVKMDETVPKSNTVPVMHSKCLPLTTLGSSAISLVC
jgi:hypothetical protein